MPISPSCRATRTRLTPRRLAAVKTSTDFTGQPDGTIFPAMTIVHYDCKPKRATKARPAVDRRATVLGQRIIRCRHINLSPGQRPGLFFDRAGCVPERRDTGRTLSYDADAGRAAR